MQLKLDGPGDHVDAIAHRVIGAAIEVHRELGPGLLELVYENAMAVELELRGMQFVRQMPHYVSYKGRNVGEGRIDLLVENVLVIELKAIDELAPVHTAQVLRAYPKSAC